MVRLDIPGRYRSIAAAIALCSANAPMPATFQGPGELAVAPTRILLEGKERAAELVLVNRGRERASYRVSLVDMRMAADGRLERLPASELPSSSAKPHLKYSPKQVTLDPGASQRIRIALQRQADLEPGEYRSHLLFEALPNSSASRSTGDSNYLTIRFQVVGAVSLPVIARVGKVFASGELCEPRIGDDGLWVKLRRTGNRSIRGDVTAYFEPNGSKSRRRIGAIRELPLYHPNAERLVRVPLEVPPSSLKGGTIVIQFQEATGLKDRVRASTELRVPA